MVAFVAAIVAFGACSGGTATPTSTPITTPPGQVEEDLSRLAEARDRWQAADISHYRFVVEENCFCPQLQAQVEVIDGEVVAVTPIGETDGQLAWDVLGRPIEGWFDQAEEWIQARHDAWSVSFDTQFGYPTGMSIDPDLDVFDEEDGYTLTSLVVLRGEPLDGAEAAAGIHGCAVFTRGEIDDLFGEAVPLGEHDAPTADMGVCVWETDDARLTLRLFPAEDGAVPEAFVAEPLTSGQTPSGRPAAWNGYMTAVIALRTVVVLEHEGLDADVDRLLEMAETAAGRLPGG
jgi:hypothetical protein